MVFEELVLHNFGVYESRQTLDLLPPSRQQPIILVGGLNGVGKTTLLDAVQLALFGKLAPCSGRGTSSYEDYLRNAIHRGVSRSEGAAVELAFRHHLEGVEQHVRIQRRWCFSGRRLRETLNVERDGKLDPVLSERWLETVDQFVPLGIARLVFFDGEKIAALANPKTCSDALAAGITALLGLDVVDRLNKDLSVYERRQRLKLVSDTDSDAMRASEQALRRLADKREQLAIRRAECQNDVDRASKRLADCEARLQVEGGNLLEQRTQLQLRRDTLANRLGEIKNDLRDKAAGLCPLLLVRGLITAAAQLAKKDSEAHEARTVQVAFENRQRRIIELLRNESIDPAILSRLVDFFHEQEQALAPKLNHPVALGLPDPLRHELTRLDATALADVEARVLDSLKLFNTVEQHLDRVERNLATIPSRDALHDLFTARVKAQHDLDVAVYTLRDIDDELRRLIRTQEQERNRHERQLIARADDALDQDDAHRAIRHSVGVRRTLEEFRTALLRRSSTRIASLVLDGFRHLLRKQHLVSEVEIDPTSFVLTLRGPNGNVLSHNSLSAGESQLLAVSLLWGLARAAGRPLPAIVDTPLGRLDSTHRTHLVERYFPSASHQVLLLSTDEEITSIYWEKLRPHVGRAYTLVHDDATTSTTLEQGYFNV